MRRKLTIKRIIIILSIVLVYTGALSYISILAKDSLLNDIAFSKDSASALSNNVNQSGLEDEAAVPVKKYTPLNMNDEIAAKKPIDDYEIFAPSETSVSVSAVTTVSAETEEKTQKSVSTAPPKTEEPKTAKVEETTTVTESAKKEVSKKESTDKPQTSETTKADEEVNIDDEPSEEDSDVEIDESDESTDENVSLSEDVSDSNSDIQDILEQFYNDFNNQNSWQTFPADNLHSGRSYRDETVTIYDKTKGRYVTDNAFDIVCGVTFNEVGTSMHPEAIKAQAVATYTYIKHYEQKGECASLSMKTDVPQLIIDCVSEVDGLAMFYDGEYIFSPYSASTGGVTCSSENVWGGERPYLVSVRNDFDHLDEKNYGRVTTYTADEVRKKIESKTNIRLSDDCENWIRILSYTDGNYVGNIAIDGHTSAVVSGKERELTAYVFRTYILNIRSTCFTVSYSNGVFTFVTYGYGHGVGLSQEGADLYAVYGGYSFDQILHHYYTGITIC